MAASPKLCVSHERRRDARKFLKQIFYYGYGRGQLFLNVPIAKQLIFVLAPIAAILFLIGAFYFPWLLLGWILIINLNYFFSTNKIDPIMILLPPLVWVFYIVGMMNGLSSGAQRLKIDVTA